jgi:glycosyltransferase involved in cell wall biosynthesis
VRDDNFLGFRLRSGEDLVLVPERDPAALASAIVELLDRPELAASVARGGRRVVDERFTLDAVTRQHLELYERLAADGAAGR